MDTLPTLLTQITGGLATSVLDREKPDWVVHVGADAAGQGGVAVTPGAMASLGLAVVAALLPGRVSGVDAKTLKAVLVNLAGGGIVYEGTKLAEQQLLPLLDQVMAPAPPPQSSVTNPPTPATHGVHGLPPGGWRPPVYSPFAVQQGLDSFRRAAA